MRRWKYSRWSPRRAARRCWSWVTCWSSDRRELHQSLKSAVLHTGAVRVFLIGAAIESLAEALGESRVTAQARRVEDLMEPILQSLAFGDAVMVKGSKGVRLALLVDKIKQR